MLEIRRTDEFSDWLRALRDARARAKILFRIDRLANGNSGDVAPVGERNEDQLRTWLSRLLRPSPD
jgi:putative addiction module killer protein